jgi:hypothetical protein
MLAKNTIRAKALELREAKRRLLEGECQNCQRCFRGEKDVKLNSATRQ